MQPKRPSNPTGRDADPRRTIPLQSGAWKRLRARVLAEEPLCRECGALATDVDHASGDPSDNSRANLNPLCHSCHSSKTMRERNGSTTGHDASGMPTDPRHPWNSGRENEKSLGSFAYRPWLPPFFQRNGRG